MTAAYVRTHGRDDRRARRGMLTIVESKRIGGRRLHRKVTAISRRRYYRRLLGLR